MDLSSKTGDTLSATVSASAAVGGLLLIVAVIVAVICLRCQDIANSVSEF